MIDQQLNTHINQRIDALKAIDLSKALRTDTGVMSLSEEFYEDLVDLLRRLDSVRDQIRFGDMQSAEGLRDALAPLNQHLSQLVNFSPTDFVANRDQYRASIRNFVDQIRRNLLSFLVLKHDNIVNPSGDSSDLTELASIRERIETEANERIANLKHEADKIISEALQTASEIQK